MSLGDINRGIWSCRLGFGRKADDLLLHKARQLQSLERFGLLKQFPSNYFCPVCELTNYKFLIPLDLPLRHLSI
jgi:hypothetical protein